MSTAPKIAYREAICDGYYRFNLPKEANREGVERLVTLFREYFQKRSGAYPQRVGKAWPAARLLHRS